MDFTIDEIESEIWKDVVGYDYEYQISNLGRFKRITAFHSRYINSITLGSFDARNYLRVAVKEGGKPKSKKVHRLVAEYFIEGYSEDLTVNHINFKKDDNRVCNLELLSASENVLDYIHKKRKEESSSKVVGVNFHTQLQKWTTRVNHKGNRTSVGTYLTEEAAIQAIEDYNNGVDNTQVGKGVREKLTKEELKELFILKQILSTKELAKKYNVCTTTILNIIRRYEN